MSLPLLVAIAALGLVLLDYAVRPSLLRVAVATLAVAVILSLG